VIEGIPSFCDKNVAVRRLLESARYDVLDAVWTWWRRGWDITCADFHAQCFEFFGE
jgi:hypothetical protein